MICLSVWDEVGDERWCELVLFGPDGESPAKIGAWETEKKKKIRKADMTMLQNCLKYVKIVLENLLQLIILT